MLGRELCGGSDDSTCCAGDAGDDFTIVLEFTNREVRCYNVKPLLDFGVFARLRDEELFRQVRVALGTAVWPGEIDICPDTLYVDSSPVAGG